MRTFWIWSIVFLSGFLAALIVAPVLTGQDAPEAAGDAPAPLIATAKDEVLPKPQPPKKTLEQQRAEDLDTLYRGDALTTLSMLKARMRDPRSTQFRNLWVVNISNENTACRRSAARSIPGTALAPTPASRPFSQPMTM